MKKVGIVTLFGYFNFGNRIQNYALERTLRKLGYEADTIVFENLGGKQDEKARAAKQSIFSRIRKMSFHEITSKAADRIYYAINKRKIEKRAADKTSLLRDFSDRYLHVVSFKKDFPVSDYACFIAGSDQVWNPCAVTKSEAYFLPFAPKPKRAAYAASFGVDEIPQEMQAAYAEGLSGFRSISVREAAGKKIVLELTGRECPVLVDPSMLLTKSEWMDFASSSPHRPGRGYVLLYFLGKMPTGAKRTIKRSASAGGLAVVDIMDRKRSFFAASPREFVDYIGNAEFVFTDSFHGTALSIVLHTPFAVFKKISGGSDQYSRIENMLGMFGMEDRALENVPPRHGYLPMDFSGADAVLRSERVRALDFLKDVIEGG